jgi:hypothetical protein
MARATPFLGHEGPGATFLKVGDVALIHSGSDARFLLLGGRFVSGDTLLRFYVLHCVAIPLAVAEKGKRKKWKQKRHELLPFTFLLFPWSEATHASDS